MTEAANSHLGEDVGDDPSPRGKTYGTCDGARHIFSVLWAWRCPRSGSLSLLENMTCVKVAGWALNAGLCSPRHSSSFQRAACVVEEEFYFTAWEKKSQEDLNKQLRQTPSRQPPQPALMARWDPQKNSKFGSFLPEEKCRKLITTHIIIILFC